MLEEKVASTHLTKHCEEKNVLSQETDRIQQIRNIIMEERVQGVRIGSTMGPKCSKSGCPQTIVEDVLLLSTRSSIGFTHPLSLNHAVKDTRNFVCESWGPHTGVCVQLLDPTRVQGHTCEPVYPGLPKGVVREARKLQPDTFAVH